MPAHKKKRNRMQVVESPMDGLKLVQLVVRHDSRGFFIERFNQARFAELGLPSEFIQDNHSYSHPGILRGMHYQYAPGQGKLVGAIRGRIWDVAVDVRPTSKTFGQHYGVELSGENGKLLWVPAGFAHGFCVLGDEPADVFYKVNAPYNPQSEGGIAFNDPDLAIQWPLAKPTVSERDAKLSSWKDYCANPPKWSLA